MKVGGGMVKEMMTLRQHPLSANLRRPEAEVIAPNPNLILREKSGCLLHEQHEA
jgi:hypothetical protein